MPLDTKRLQIAVNKQKLRDAALVRNHVANDRNALRSAIADLNAQNFAPSKEHLLRAGWDGEKFLVMLDHRGREVGRATIELTDGGAARILVNGYAAARIVLGADESRIGWALGDGTMAGIAAVLERAKQLLIDAEAERLETS